MANELSNNEEEMVQDQMSDLKHQRKIIRARLTTLTKKYRKKWHEKPIQELNYKDILNMVEQYEQAQEKAQDIDFRIREIGHLSEHDEESMIEHDERHEAVENDMKRTLEIAEASEKGLKLLSKIKVLKMSPTLLSGPEQSMFSSALQHVTEFSANATRFREEGVTNLSEEITAQWIEVAQMRNQESLEADRVSLRRREQREDERPPTPATEGLNFTPFNPNNQIKLKPPTFSGEPKEWQTFWKLMSPLIERQRGLTDYEKITILTSAMKGKAATLANVIAGVYDSYAEVVEQLKREYDTPKELYRLHIQDMLKTTTNRTKDGLMESLRKIDALTTSLTQYNGLTASQLRAGIMETGMSPRCKEQWLKFTVNDDDPPTLEKMKEFLLNEARSISSTTRDDFVHKLDKAEKNDKNDKHDGHDKGSKVDKGSKQKFFGTDSTGKKFEKRAPRCNFCDSEGHWISSCDRFVQLTVAAREAKAIEKKWCVNCLIPGHLTINCRSLRRCRDCNEKHHSLLHRSSTSTESAARANKANIGSDAVLPLTAKMNVSSSRHKQEVRAYLDPGSDATLITRRLANQLKAERKETRTVIKGIASEQSSQHTVELTLTSDQNPLEVIKTRAYVVNSLGDKLPQTSISSADWNLPTQTWENPARLNFSWE